MPGERGIKGELGSKGSRVSKKKFPKIYAIVVLIIG